MFLDRAKNSISSARAIAPMIGWRWVIGRRVLARLGITEVKLRTPGLPHPVACRTETSDIFEYTHLLSWGQVPLNLPIRPEYIVDAGANVGFSALRFQKEFPGATIVGLEPEPRNFAQFRKNCGPYPNISIEQAALWSRNTKLSIRSLDVDSSSFRVDEDSNGEVNAISILEVMKRHDLPRIDLLKIDIEGSEKVLFSDPHARDWLKHVGVMLVETHDRFEPGCTAAINKATDGLFEYKGIIDEYSCYVGPGSPAL
jgi:FkbM family methyltransferase